MKLMPTVLQGVPATKAFYPISKAKQPQAPNVTADEVPTDPRRNRRRSAVPAGQYRPPCILCRVGKSTTNSST